LHWIDLPVAGSDRPLGRLIVLQDVTEARQVEQLRKDLTHTMVHDLRNPLTSINGALQILAATAQTSLEPTQKEFLTIARNGTQKMLNLVNAILDVSQLESRRMPVQCATFSLHETVNAVVRLQQPLVEKQQVQLHNEIDVVLPTAWADPALIERVLQNLIGNALKFTPRGGNVHITARQKAEMPGKLYVSVSDTGPGIPPELQEHLFQKFVTGKQVGKGSGLGLAFCRMVLEAHGERIWVTSTLGQGTTFTFTLPVVAPETIVSEA